MAFRIKYHLLFEVRIFHGYHLKDEVDFYGSGEEDKATDLINGNYDISQDIQIVPTEECKKILKNHRLRFKATSLGFMVGIETKRNPAGDLFPFLSIGEGTVFHFKIKLKNPNWTNFSNVKLKAATGAKYYFSNFEQLDSFDIDNGIFRPTLSLSHESFNAERPYEMGEIVEDGGLRIATKNSNGILPSDNDNWGNFTDFNYVSETDRRLLPSRFSYHIPDNGTPINDIIFRLKKPDDTVESTYTENDLNGKKTIRVDFRKIENERQVNILAGEYTLEVESAGFNETKSIHIDDELFDVNDWGIVAIAHQADLEDHRILEDDGKLRLEGGDVQYPIFEIRMKSRETYWQYVLHNADAIPPGDYGDFTVAGKQAISKEPISLSRFPKSVSLNLDGHQLPHPNNLMVKMNEDKTKYISEIYLPILEAST